MPNLASALKEEIRRLARKEVKAQVGTTKQAASRYRREIAALKRQLRDVSRKLARLERSGGQATETTNGDDELNGTRFSARSVKAQRRRLGLSAAKYGQLVGVSGLTIYNWEQGKSRPRKAQMTALVAVRGLGKRELKQRLEQLA